MISVDDLKTKLKNLPNTPGVYFFKDHRARIIYVGKASVLKNRVKSYFHNSKHAIKAQDIKTALLIQEIHDVEWRVVDSEIEALFLESEMIKRYLPKYNIDLRDDKQYQYVRIDLKATHPTVKIVRRPLDDGSKYFGPYISGVREALRFLRRIFPFDYSVPSSVKNRPSLHYHIGLSPGLEAGKTTLIEYRASLKKLGKYLSGQGKSVQRQLEREMNLASHSRNYERATVIRNQLHGLRRLENQIIFSHKEQFDISKDQALSDLARILGLADIPHKIEGYDISHISGTHNVASMVVFTNGVSDKSQYRKFKMRLPGNDDFAHMGEVISRRFSGQNLERWSMPDLILIDGGKGQLQSALNSLKEKKISIPSIGLAKRDETIITSTKPKLDQYKFKHVGKFYEIYLPKDSHAVKLLQRVRDESHRFAVGYHTLLRDKKQTISLLEEIPDIGPVTRKKLIRHFGSLKLIRETDQINLEKLIGKSRAKLLSKYLQ
jgi:excinuclease ABC subunit C